MRSHVHALAHRQNSQEVPEIGFEKEKRTLKLLM